jgi:hypothetical protein
MGWSDCLIFDIQWPLVRVKIEVWSIILSSLMLTLLISFWSRSASLLELVSFWNPTEERTTLAEAILWWNYLMDTLQTTAWGASLPYRCGVLDSPAMSIDWGKSRNWMCRQLRKEKMVSSETKKSCIGSTFICRQVTLLDWLQNLTRFRTWGNQILSKLGLHFP